MMVAVVRFSDRAVCSKNDDARACNLDNAIAEHAKVFLIARLSDIHDLHIARTACRHELGIVAQELVQAIHDIHSASDGIEEHDPLALREHPTRRCHPEDEVPWHESDKCQRMGKILVYGDAIGLVTEYHPGVESALLAVDYGDDLVQLGVANESVRGLAIEGTEASLAVHDGGCAPILRWVS